VTKRSGWVTSGTGRKLDMKQRLLLLTFVFAGLILLSRPIYAASFCITPDITWAAARAEVIFSGRITKVEPVEASPAAAGDYFVTFKVETWWKGTPSPEMRVLWRTSVQYCPLLPVGEVGEDYLVYAEPSRSTSKAQFPEVTTFNRTSRLPANWKPESFFINDWKIKTQISPGPELNRADASDDMKVLRILRACGCLPAAHFSPLDKYPIPREVDAASTCGTCWRSMLRPF
jgi:hypothetical protein